MYPKLYVRTRYLGEKNVMPSAHKVVEVDPGYFLVDKDDADAKYADAYPTLRGIP
jgi:hypothetical protein